jgi:hypothetical protein
MITLRNLIVSLSIISFGMQTRADDLAIGFRDPPHSAGIRAFWWWLNGNVTKEAITRDLEQMKAKGFNGALIFDADGSNQRGNERVPAGPTFGSQAWTELFVHACREADRLELELSLNLQSGWNLGGPNVSAQEATQTLIWSTTKVIGPLEAKVILPKPKARDFYQDVAVIAVPLPAAAPTQAIECAIQASSTKASSHQSYAIDGDRKTFWVSNDAPRPEMPQTLTIRFDKPTEISEWSLLGRPGYGPRRCLVQLSTDQQTFQTVKEFSIEDGQTATTKIAPQRASCVRFQFPSAYDRNPVNGQARNVQVAEISLPGIVLSGQPSFVSIKDLPLKSSTRELGNSAPDCRFLLEHEPPQPNEPVVPHDEIINLTSAMNHDGEMAWTVPDGQWAVLRIGHTNTGAHVSTESADWSGQVLDYMSSDSLDAYWSRNIEPLMKAIGPLAGTTLRYVHTDSWEGGGMNWTPGFDQTFQQNRGYDPIPWLAVLAGYVVDNRKDSNAFLADFRKTIGDRVAGHYEHLARLANQHGVGTHPECSGPHAGPLDGLKNYGRSELMMSEFWSPSPHRPNPPERFFVKQASSAAHTYGKRLVGAEGFTTIGPHWNDVPWSAMKPSFDHEFCAGLNLLFNHTFTCSPDELGLPGQEYFAGTHFNPQVTWWDESVAVIDYFRRCQYLAQQGKFVADVLYYYGDHVPNIAALKESDPAGALPGFDYDVLSEELLLSRLTVDNGQVTLPSGMRYCVLVLPDHRILSLGAIKKINELVREGATVLGQKPRWAVSLEGGLAGEAEFQTLAHELWGPEDFDPTAKGIRPVGKGRIAWGMTAQELLHRDRVPPDVTFDDEQVAAVVGWIHYQIESADVYFLSEPNGQAIDATAIFRCSGKIPELWDAVDGSMRESQTFAFRDGRTEVPIQLDPFGSIFVVFRKATSSDRNAGSNFADWQPARSLAGPWDVAFDAARGGPAQSVRLDSLIDWTEHNDPAIKYYSGKATYRTSFTLDDKLRGKPLAIQLGQVKDVGIAKVRLNGRDVGIVWRPPFRVNISELVKPGENELEVTVVNSWRNRLIGDRTLPEGKRQTRTNINVTPDWQLAPSGLLGPVMVETAGKE